jgi:hypothetical protein
VPTDELLSAHVFNSRQLVDLEYKQNAGITEEVVKDLVCRELSRDGYSLKKSLPKGKGADIEGWSIHKGGVIVEAKGEGSRPEMFRNFFLAALGQIVMRTSEENTRYIVALPAHEKFVRLVRAVSQHARKKLNLEFWLIGTVPIRYSIHIVYPDFA